jgi:hypothetical protein
MTSTTGCGGAVLALTCDQAPHPLKNVKQSGHMHYRDYSMEQPRKDTLYLTQHAAHPNGCTIPVLSMVT